MHNLASDLFAAPYADLGPLLWIEEGTQMGHARGPWRSGIDQVLVEVTCPVVLESGLHLFVAPNGSGKTTVLRTLAGLHPALRGRLKVAGEVFYVSDQLQLDMELSAQRLFETWFRGSALSYCYGLVERLTLNVDCAMNKLSRGNRQKVMLVVAETLAAGSGPSLLLLDEPLAGMDAETREVVAEFWASTNKTVLRLVVLHELDAVKKADSLFTVSRGQLRHTYRQTGSWAETCRRLRA